MNPQDTIDLSREAIVMAAMIGGPILVAGLLIGLVLGVLQAMTQIQDQTVSAVPKIVGMALVALLALPWISDQMVDFTRASLSQPLVGGMQKMGQPLQRESNPARSAPVRFAAAQNLRLPVYTAPVGSIPAGPIPSSSPSHAAMPAMRYQGSSMPRMVFPKSPTSTPTRSPFRLPAFGRSAVREVHENIGG